ncbi:MAG: lipopolysaccharide biosynthesis protein [Bacteroidales bacterium]|nr:lipopolysaccharide biosynthesis protein [Bacteroidales bacterium]
MPTSSNTSRIAKNTLLLYFRMLLTMGVSLYTSRVILSALGVEDYGIYNVVGGVVAMFGILSGSLSSAISRFITFELGKGNLDKLKRIFCTSVNIQIILIAIITILMETIGIWFLNNKMVIPEGRLAAANWVFQFSVITFALNLLSVPYNAVIIAHEKMSAFAYISIIDCTLKLIVAFIIAYNPFDRLVYYGLLIMIVGLINRMMYAIYSKKHFEEATYRMIFDKGLMKEMFGFAGWNALGTGAYVFNTQGVNLVTNIFFGAATNAARAVATQAETAIKQFVTNFTTAINPQITKSYAAGDMEYLYNLVCKGSKFSYLIMLFFAVPFMFETETIMQLWLNNYPPEAPLFLRLSLFGTMVDLLGNSPAVATWATGNVRRYYIYVSAVGCLVFPLSWLAFALGMSAYTSYIIFLIVYVAVLFTKLYIIKGLMNFPVAKYYRDVLLVVVYTTAAAFVIPGIICHYMPQGLLYSLVMIAICCISVGLCIYLLGLSSVERMKINDLAKQRIAKIKKV